MTAKLTTITILFLTIISVIGSTNIVFAQDIPREKLLSLAHNFVSRIGQKLQDQTPHDSKSFMNIAENELLILQPRINGKTMIEGSIAALRKNKISLSLLMICVNRWAFH